MRPLSRHLIRATALLWLALVAIPARAQPSFVQNGNILTMSNLNVTVQYNLSTGNAAFYWQNLQIISAFYSGISFTSGQGYIMGINYANWTYSILSSNQVMVTATGNGYPTMQQIFTFDATNSFLVKVQAVGTNISANWMGPVVVHATDGVDIHSYGDVRALFVPFDNDKNVTYNAMSINSTDTGYEVGAFYDNVSRNGIVVGSVTHDTWKSGVFWDGVTNTLFEMNVFGGANSSTYTHDVQPHGSVSGGTISSPTMFVGYGLDWRRTMQEFVNENLKFTPKLTWTNSVPFGWNSWGVIQTAINYTDATNASGFIYGNLQKSNFNDNGTVYINLDSYWSVGLSPGQVQSFVNYCHANGQKCGLYFAAFAWFGAASNAPSTVVDGTAYTYDQIILKTTNGTYITDGSGIALDPTHPGTQEHISYMMDLFTNYGIDYLKIDFLTHGSLEGVHYNTNIVTGIQAYNVGMQYLYNLMGPMFISESIAPLFPYQYGHSRRIACDAEASKIANTAYTLNSVTYGWWLDRLYCFNDPDIMVFDGPTTNENQSRLISGAITGLFLDGDSFTNSTSQADAIRCLTNAAINSVARFGESFLATEDNTGTNAANTFVLENGTTWYLAEFNYGSSSVSTNVDLVRAGVSGNFFGAVDLWAGATNALSGTTLPVSLNGKQAKLFKFLNVPYFQSPQAPTNGAFSVSLFGNNGSIYAILTSTNLSNWTTLETITNTTGNALVTFTNLPGPANYYRAQFLQ